MCSVCTHTHTTKTVGLSSYFRSMYKKNTDCLKNNINMLHYFATEQ